MNLHMDKNHRPFSTGRQWAEWDERNCGSCRLGFDMKHGKFRCAHQFCLTSAAIGDGLITEATARAVGFLDSEGSDLWECPGWERGRG